MTPTNYYELKGMESNKCILYTKYGHTALKFTDSLIQTMLAQGKTQEEIQAAESAGSSTEGGSLCKYSSTTFLTKMFTGAKSGAIHIDESCALTQGGSICTTSDGVVIECTTLS
jgi:hypothetical protein